MESEPKAEDLHWHLELYRRMYLVRKSEELIQDHYSEDEMKTPVHLYIGQEAVAVGVCDALAADDQVVGTYRSHGVYLAQTDDPEGMFAELYGKVTGPGRGKAGSMHICRPEAGVMMTSAVVGTTIPVAVGLAYSNDLCAPERMVAAFFGDGAIDEGVFWESLNFACLKRLPVLFVCEDNGLAIHTRGEERHGYRDIAEVVASFDCQVVTLDSTDPAEISEATAKAIEAHRADGRPIFLHAKCYRFVEHVGIRNDEDFEHGYRSREEFATWSARDPLPAQRKRLLDRGMSELRVLELEKDVDERLHRCVLAAKAGELPLGEELVRDVFCPGSN